jgi:hypothetical protein
MKSVCCEKLFYGIQHLENFLLIFFLVPHRAVPDLQRMKRPFSDAIFFYIWRPSRMFYALVSIQAPLAPKQSRVHGAASAPAYAGVRGAKCAARNDTLKRHAGRQTSRLPARRTSRDGKKAPCSIEHGAK